MRPKMSLIGWCYKRPDGARVGPLSSAEVACLLVQGHLRPTEKLVEITESLTAAGSDTRYSYSDAETAARTVQFG